MMRVPLLITWAGLLTAGYPATVADQSAKQLNVIIIMTDDQGHLVIRRIRLDKHDVRPK